MTMNDAAVRERLQFFGGASAASRALRDAVRRLARGERVAIVADAFRSGRALDVEFLGRRMRATELPAWLASRAGVPLVPVVFARRGGALVALFGPRLPVGRSAD